MEERLHILVDRLEKERYRQAAERQGKALSAWIREAAREKWDSEQVTVSLETPEDLREFFRRCDAHEEGREPDWDEHLNVIRRSIASGSASDE